MKLKRGVVIVALLLAAMLMACNNSFLDYDSNEDNLKFFNFPISGKNNQNKDRDKTNSYTLLVYMCGSDLESEQGYATKDLEEMCSSKYGDNINVIVETGGTRHWDSEVIDEDKLSRYRINNGYAELLESFEPVSMGESSTLADFLMWGVTEYPSDSTSVILWNHGSGSAYGVCFDELFNDDSLYLSEIEEAFNKTCKGTDITFDFVGFDACMMATIETAGVLADYADYMIASQEVESGCGWNYTELLEYISDNTDIDGYDIGKKVCDDYMEECGLTDEQDEATMSCIDLSKFEQFRDDFKTFTSNIAKTYDQKDEIKLILKKIMTTKNYGGNNAFEGYTNMIDAGDMFTNLKSQVDGADEARKSLDSMVVYQSTGSDNNKSTGLSVYYPIKCQGAEELESIADVAVSTYYTGLINYVTYRSVIKDDYDDDKYDWATKDPEYWQNCSFYSQIEDEQSENSKIEFLKDDGVVELSSRPQMTDEGDFTAVIKEDSMDYVQGVYSSVFAAYGKDSLLYLGKDNNVYMDSSTGEISDNFWGGWGTLPDGQLITMEIAEEGEDYNIYTVPILLNGEVSNMRVKWLWTGDTDGYYTVLGAWDGIETNGSSDRNTIKIKKGDVIIPVYTIYNKETGETSEEYGEELKVGKNFGVKDDYLPANDYYYSFEITDIYGGTVFTDTAVFYVDDSGKVWYYNN